jgi:DNA-binding NtrC family response regulator
MKEKILIVEDQFVEADYLRLMLTQSGYLVTGIARSVQQAREMIRQQNPDLVLLDIFLKGKETGIDLAKQLAEENIPFVYLSANSNEDVLQAAKATQPYGFLVKPFREKDLLVTLEIAKYRHDYSLEARYRKEVALQKNLNSIINIPVSWDQKILKIAAIIQPHIPYDFMAVGFDNIGQPHFKGLCFLRIGFDEYQVIGLKELTTITTKSVEELIALQSNNPDESFATFYDDTEFKNLCRFPSLRKLFADTFQLKSHLEMPMRIFGSRPFSFCLYSRRSNAYNTEQLELFQRIQLLLVSSIEAILHNELTEKNNVQQQNGYPHENNAGKAEEFNGIIGKSHLLLNALDLVNQVAPMDTSVLILGESGTGKEKIADCIHLLSKRKQGPFVKVNCAALPATLIESELFGYEKGSFTGATEKRIGKFEKADKGTIFLDEIGEMPVELQTKLLRVLQEKEIEPIGAKAPVRINVRIIAATNRNLEKEVAEGRFRLDLYYRLNVFPMTLPSLKDRREDIPLLATHFINLYNRKSGKKINRIADKVLSNMMDYDWPGNIRELEHMIERSVLLAKGTTIEEMPLPVHKIKIPGNSDDHIKTIHENERDYIISILKKCNNKIWGSGGAAELLNLPPSTLKSKMQKLGIKREYTK